MYKTTLIHNCKIINADSCDTQALEDVCVYFISNGALFPHCLAGTCYNSKKVVIVFLHLFFINASQFSSQIITIPCVWNIDFIPALIRLAKLCDVNPKDNSGLMSSTPHHFGSQSV